MRSINKGSFFGLGDHAADDASCALVPKSAFSISYAVLTSSAWDGPGGTAGGVFGGVIQQGLNRLSDQLFCWRERDQDGHNRLLRSRQQGRTRHTSVVGADVFSTGGSESENAVLTTNKSARYHGIIHVH